MINQVDSVHYSTSMGGGEHNETTTEHLSSLQDRSVPHARTLRHAREHVKQMVISEVAPRKIRRYLLDWSAWWVRTTINWTKQDLLTRLRVTCWDVTIGHIIQELVGDYINSDRLTQWDLQGQARVIGVAGLVTV